MIRFIVFISFVIAIALGLFWHFADTDLSFLDYYDDLAYQKFPAIYNKLKPKKEERLVHTEDEIRYLRITLKDGFNVEGELIKILENGNYSIKIPKAIMNINKKDIVNVLDVVDEEVKEIKESLYGKLQDIKIDYSKEIVWRDNIDKVLATAGRKKKLVMIDFTAKWCVWCKKLDKITFQDINVRTKVNKNFIAVRIDGDKNKDLLKKYKVKGFPNIVFLNTKGKIIYRIPGFLSPNVFLLELDKIIKKG